MAQRNRHHPKRHHVQFDFAHKKRPPELTEAEKAEAERIKAKWLAENKVKRCPTRKPE